MTCGGGGSEGMASPHLRDDWTAFMRRQAADLRGGVAVLGRRLWRRVPVVPAKYLVLLRRVAAGLAVGMLGLALPAILLGAFPHLFEGRRLPLQDVRGVVPGEDA